jgi:hypothetical protein
LGEREILFEESDKDFRSRSRDRKMIGVVLVLMVPIVIMAFSTIFLDTPREHLWKVIIVDSIISIGILIASFFFIRWYFRQVRQAAKLIIYRKDGEVYFDINKRSYPLKDTFLQSYPSSFEILYKQDEGSDIEKYSVNWLSKFATERLFEQWYSIVMEDLETKAKEKGKRIRIRRIEHTGEKKEYTFRSRSMEMIYFFLGMASTPLVVALIFIFILFILVGGIMSIAFGLSWLVNDILPLSNMCFSILALITGIGSLVIILFCINSYLGIWRDIEIVIRTGSEGIEIVNRSISDGSEIIYETIPYGAIRSMKQIREKEDRIPYLRFSNPYINRKFDTYCPQWTLKSRLIRIVFRKEMKVRPWFPTLDRTERDSIEPVLMRAVLIPMEHGDQKEFIGMIGTITRKNMGK